MKHKFKVGDVVRYSGYRRGEQGTPSKIGVVEAIGKQRIKVRINGKAGYVEPENVWKVEGE